MLCRFFKHHGFKFHFLPPHSSPSHNQRVVEHDVYAGFASFASVMGQVRHDATLQPFPPRRKSAGQYHSIRSASMGFTFAASLAGRYPNSNPDGVGDDQCNCHCNPGNAKRRIMRAAGVSAEFIIGQQIVASIFGYNAQFGLPDKLLQMWHFCTVGKKIAAARPCPY